MTDKDGLIGRPVVMPEPETETRGTFHTRRKIKKALAANQINYRKRIAALETELAKANTACGKWNVDYNKTYSELCEAHVEIDMLEAELAKVRAVAEDAIKALRGLIYGRHRIPGPLCPTCVKADELDARLK